MSNNQKTKQPKIKIDYSTAKIASEHEQCSDKTLVTYYCDNARGEKVLCKDAISKLPDELIELLYPKPKKNKEKEEPKEEKKEEKKDSFFSRMKNKEKEEPKEETGKEK